MREQINSKINLARNFMRLRDYRKAQIVLREAEQLVLQTPSYPYWAALNRMLDDTRLELGEPELAATAPAVTVPPVPRLPINSSPAVEAQAAAPAPNAPLAQQPPADSSLAAETQAALAQPTGFTTPVSAPPPDSLLLLIDGKAGLAGLTPTLLARDVAPFVQALEALQHAFNAARGLPNQPVIVRHIGQNSPPCLEASGLEQAAQAARQVISPWRAENAPRRLAWDADRAQFARDIASARSQMARMLLSWLPCDPPDPARAMPEALLPPLDLLMFGPVSIQPEYP